MQNAITTINSALGESISVTYCNSPIRYNQLLHQEIRRSPGRGFFDHHPIALDQVVEALRLSPYERFHHMPEMPR